MAKQLTGKNGFTFFDSNNEPEYGPRTIERNETTDAYTTTTNNTAGSKNSTDTHEWEETTAMR